MRIPLQWRCGTVSIQCCSPCICIKVWITLLLSERPGLLVKSAVPCRGRKITLETAPSIAHQEDKRARVVLRCPIPIPQKNGVEHKPGLAFAEQDVAEGLRHQIAP